MSVLTYIYKTQIDFVTILRTETILIFLWGVVWLAPVVLSELFLAVYYLGVTTKVFNKPCAMSGIKFKETHT